MSAITELPETVLDAISAYRNACVDFGRNTLDVATGRKCDAAYRDMLNAIAALTPTAAERAGRVVVTPDEMAALHHLSDYTHYLSDKASDGFYSLYNRCVVTEEVGRGE